MQNPYFITYLQKLYQRIGEEIAHIQVTIDLINSRKVKRSSYGDNSKRLEHSEGVDYNKSKKILLPEKRYIRFAKLDRKIAFALTKLGMAFKEDIIEIVKKEEPEQNLHKLGNVISVRLSYLLKNKLIEANKEGKKYRYRIKDL